MLKAPLIDFDAPEWVLTAENVLELEHLLGKFDLIAD
jgi:hypothetical protein